jgi:hypothetical protein
MRQHAVNFFFESFNVIKPTVEHFTNSTSILEKLMIELENPKIKDFEKFVGLNIQGFKEMRHQCFGDSVRMKQIGESI